MRAVERSERVHARHLLETARELRGGDCAALSVLLSHGAVTDALGRGGMAALASLRGLVCARCHALATVDGSACTVCCAMPAPAVGLARARAGRKRARKAARAAARESAVTDKALQAGAAVRNWQNMQGKNMQEGLRVQAGLERLAAVGSLAGTLSSMTAGATTADAAADSRPLDATRRRNKSQKATSESTVGALVQPPPPQSSLFALLQPKSEAIPQTRHTFRR